MRENISTTVYRELGLSIYSMKANLTKWDTFAAFQASCANNGNGTHVRIGVF